MKLKKKIKKAQQGGAQENNSEKKPIYYEFKEKNLTPGQVKKVEEKRLDSKGNKIQVTYETHTKQKTPEGVTSVKTALVKKVKPKSHRL